MRYFARFIPSALLACLFFLTLSLTPSVQAAGITVNNDADITADDGFCTLREAIYNANNDLQQFNTSGECATGSGTDTITFDAGLSGQIIYLGAELPVSSDMTIDGSALASQVTIDGSANGRVFIVNSGTVTLNSLKIMNGYDVLGAGIYNASGATLTVTNSTLSGNNGQDGGAIHNKGLMTITNTTISGNSALTGAGIYNASGATLTITNSTLSGNSAQGAGGIHNLGSLTITNSTFSDNHAWGGDGGGIYNESGLTITNSTFSGNEASGSGGGIYNYNTMTVTNSTFSVNSASANNGGGIYNFNTLNYANTIIANSTSGGDCANSGTLGANINNLVEDGSCASGGANFLSVDPGLDSLKDNGGPAQTMSLIVTSPAIDAGDDTVCDDNPGPNNLDQRGVTRPIGAHCDIGAFEGALDIIAPTVDSFTVLSSSTSLTVPITAFTASDNVAVTGYLVTESATPPAAGAAGWTASAPSTYTVSSDGLYTLYPWAKDAVGHVSPVFGSPASVKVDTSAPTVVSSVRVNANPTTAASVDFIVTFSESVTGVDSTDFRLTTTGSINGAAVSGVSGSGTTYTVTVTTGSGAGTIRLDVVDNDSIVDATSHLLGGLGAGNGAFTSGEAYTIPLHHIYLPFVMAK
jgi:CSLREA domain-containing protein